MLVEEKIVDKTMFVYTGVSTANEARALGLAAINEKLAVCADFWPISSVYPWNGVIQDVDQHMLVLTTKHSLSVKLVNFVNEIHSYSIPCVASFEVAFMNPPYSFWVDKTLEGKDDYVSLDEEKRMEKNKEEGGYHAGHLK